MKNSLIIKSDIENLRQVEKFIDEAFEQYKFNDEIYGNMLIATLEAVNNAVTHGNKKDINKTVEVTLRKIRSCIEILIKDEGEGFDYTDIPDPTAPENIEKISGRGIFLMKKLSDEIEFIEKGKVVKLSFKIK